MNSNLPPQRDAASPTLTLPADTADIVRYLPLREPQGRAAIKGDLSDGDASRMHLAALAALMAEESGIALFQSTLRGGIIENNQAFADLCRTGGGSLGNPPIPGFQAIIARTAVSGKTHTRPVTLDVDGVTRHYWCRYVPVFDDRGEVTAVAGAFQDWTASLGRVNDAVRDQQRFRDFARACSDWFWETDATFRLTAVSDRLSALLGRPASMLVGQRIDEIGRLEDNLSGDCPFERVRTSHAPFRDQLMEVENEDGEAVLFHLSGVPLFDVDGQFIGYRGAGMDVTRQYLMEEEARGARARLETTLDELQKKNAALDIVSGHARSALKTKNEFLASMSHELRTPLNAIIGFAEAMEMTVFGALDPHYVAYARDIRNAGRHLLGLIDDVLDVSVIESGEINLSLETVPLPELVDQARSLVALRAEAKGIDLSGVVLNDPVSVRADERRALQILVNLLINAVKFTPEGGRIWLTVRCEADWVSLTVSDSGIGIASDHHEMVFEKFQQCVSDTYKGKPEGTGLGLHISRELARLMGGEITLASKLGEGAHFTVRLPRA